MSQQIENQIVKMQFDNASFEKNAKESMSTLERLKQALHFDKVNMTPLQQAFSETENTAAKAGFHIRDIWLKVASTIEDQIANKIVNAGKKVFNALTLEGVSDGFKEYELKMGSIQTIMAGTGESLATVNKYLEDLNTYSDKTIYSFSDMTNSIGKFTNAGVKLGDAVDAIKGIANEAAVSGANSNEASRAMYNFAQALSAGYVKLIDWKSIENANMATKEFKQTLIDVAQGIGTVKKVGDDWQTTTTNAQGKISDMFNATKNFNDSLAHQWMTTEVLNKTLKIYATDIRDTSVDVEAYEKMLREELHLNEDQIVAFERMGMKAADAATEIKTFTMLIDTLKEAIGSGWAMTWQYFIGDFEQAKALWTEVGSTLGGMIDKMSEARNRVIKSGLQTGWEKFTTMEGMAIPESEKFRDILVDIAEEHGILTREQKVNIKSTNDLMKSFHELGWASGDLLREAVASYTDTLNGMSDEEKEAMGITDEMMSQMKELNKFMKTDSDYFGGRTFDEMAKGMNELGGRENILQGLRNLFESLSDVIKPVKEAFRSVFEPLNPKKLFDITVRFREFTEQLKVSEDAAKTIKTAFTLAFGGIKTVITGIGTAIKGVSKLILPMLNLFDAVFGLAGKIISALTGSNGALEVADKFGKVGDKISNVYIWAMEKLAAFINKVADAIRGIPDLKIFRKIHDGVESAIQAVKDFWQAFVEMPVIQQMVEDFNNTVAKIEATVTPIIDKVRASFDKLGTTVDSKMNMKTLNDVITKVYNKVKQFVTLIKDFTTRIKTFFTNLKSGKSIVESFRESFGDIVDKVKELKDKLFSFFEDLFSKGDEMGKKFDLEKVQQAIRDFVHNITPEQITMIAVASSFMLIALNLMRLSEALRNAVDAFTGIGTALKNLINSYIKKQKSTILQVAEAIVIVAAALWVLSEVPEDKLTRAVGAIVAIGAVLTVLTAVLTGAAIAIDKFGGKRSMVELATGLVLISGAFMVAALSLKVLEYVNLEGALGKVVMITLILTALTGLSILMSKIDKFNKGTLSIVALAGALFITASALAEISNISNDKIQSSMTILYEMMIGLSAVVFAASKVGVFSAVGLLAVVLMIDKLIPTLERMVNYDYSAIQKGLSRNEAIIKKLGMVVLGMVAIGALAGNRLKGAGLAIISITASFAALLGVAKLASMMKPSELDQGTKFLWSLTGMLAVLELCSRKSTLGMFGGKDGGEGSKAFMKLAATMAILLGVAKLASMMEAKDLIKGGIAIAALSVLIGLMSAVAAKSEKSEGVIKNISVMLFGLSLILAEVALLSMIPLENMAPAFAAIIAIMLAMAAIAMALGKSVQVIDKTQFKQTSILLPFVAAVIGVLAVGHLIREMAKENSDGVMKATGSIVAVMVAVAALAKTLSTIKAGSIAGSSVLAIIESVVMVAVIGAILAAIAYFMGTLKINGNKMQSAANAIATTLLAMVPLLAIMGSPWLGGDGKKYRKMTRAVGLAIGAVLAIGTTLALMSRFGNPDGIVKSAVGLAIAMVALCAPIAVIGMIGQFCQVNDPLSFVGIVAGAIVAAAFIGGIITKMSLTANPDSVIKTAQALSLAMLAMSVPILVLGVVGALCKSTNPLTILAAVGGAVLALWSVSEILMTFAHGMDMAAIDILNAALPALTIAMIGVIGAAAALAAIGMIPGSGFAALEPVLAAIAAFTLVIAAIAILGSALNVFEPLRKSLETGLEFLVQIAEKIGEAIGAFIGGIGVGFSATMPTIAKNLSDFSEELKPFAKNMTEISSKVAEGCKNLAVAILAIAGATVVESISRLLNLGLGNGGDLGFAQLGIGLRAFCNEIKDIPDDIIKKANTCSTIAKRLGDIASGLGVEGGVIGFFVGKKKDIGDFGKGISEFGKGIKTFCENVQGLPETALADAQNACDVSRPMVALTENLTSTEGFLQKIIGEKDLGKFGTNLADFAKGLLEFVKGLVSIEEVDPNYGDLIQRCADGTTPIVNLASRVQNAGGKLAVWLGDNTLDVFGATLVPFATELAKFIAVLNYIDTKFPEWSSMITRTANATRPLIQLADGMDEIGGVKSWFSGDNTLAKFGDTLVSFAFDLHGYAEVLSTVDFSRFDQAGKIAEDLIGLGSLASTLPKNAFKNLMDGLKDLGSATIWTIASEVALSTPDLVKSYADMCDAVLNALAARKSDDMEVFKEYGQGIVLNVKKGIEHDTSTVREALDGLIRTIKNYLEDSFKSDNFKNYGRYLVEGLANGISENASLVTGALEGVAESGKKVIPEVWQEHSPSKLSYGWGKFLDLGAANGVKDYSSNVVDATEDMATDVVTGANNIISQLARVIDSNVDTQPSIRPVLDTTGIENGAKKLNKIFDDNDLSLAYGISGGIRRSAAMKADKLYSSNDVKTTAKDTSNNGAQISFTQNNYSPKALNRTEIYRQTKNQVSMLKMART